MPDLELGANGPQLLAAASQRSPRSYATVNTHHPARPSNLPSDTVGPAPSEVTRQADPNCECLGPSATGWKTVEPKIGAWKE